MTARVLILAGRPQVALVAARALSRAGYDVAVAGPPRPEPIVLSRHVTRYERVPAIDDSFAEWARGIRRIVPALAAEVIVATSDAEILGLTDLDLGVPRCPAIGPEHIALIDKHLLGAAAGRAGVQYPETQLLRDRDVDTAAVAGLAGPVVVKAARTAFRVGDQIRLARGATVVGDAHSAARAISDIRDRGGDPILQQHIVGRKFQAAVLRRHGNSTFRLAVEVERQFPGVGGSEATLRNLNPDTGTGAQLVEGLERLVDLVGYFGLLQAEFQVTDADEAYLIDANPRLYGSFAFPERMGMRLAERAVLDALGRELPTLARSRAGRRYHHVAREIGSIVKRESTARSVVAAMRSGDVWDGIDLRDPAPDLVFVARAVRARARAPVQRDSVVVGDPERPSRQRRPPRRGAARPHELAVKRLIDIVGALVALVVLSPVLAVTAAALAATQGRPILFRQVRPGLHGATFTVVKFRTMRSPRPDEVWFASDAERLTRIGRFLRVTSIDELPQLWNVLRGEMSLVGPRPLLVEYLGSYTPDEARRHDMRPGITGWAAVNGRTSGRFEDRLTLDTWYVDNWSLLLDLRIIARTVGQVVRREGAMAAQRDDDIDFPERFLAALEGVRRGASDKA